MPVRNLLAHNPRPKTINPKPQWVGFAWLLGKGQRHSGHVLKSMCIGSCFLKASE